MTDTMDTIFALASAPGRAGVAVVRISGPKAGQLLQDLSRKDLPKPRYATVRALYNPESGVLLDRALVLYFVAPFSFTGEDVVELHLHGGHAVLDGVITAFAGVSGLRPALPGEFSRRAFENGRMDLTEAEAINDLVMAQTEAQRAQALRQMDGALGRLYEGWRAKLMESLALIEADIDFPDEDLPEGMAVAARPALEGIRQAVISHLNDGGRGERLRHGVSIVLIGAPNVGKSSLLNSLSKRDAAIVSEIAGTTRDIIEVDMNLGGYPAMLVDTAGIREAGDVIEAEGVRRAMLRAERAELRLLLAEATDWPDLPQSVTELWDDRTILVLNKVDRKDDLKPGRIDYTRPAFAISASDRQGLGPLMDYLEKRVVALCDVTEAPTLTRARHRSALEDCAQSLERFTDMADQDPVLAAEDVRLAARALGRITGRVDVEDLLDVVFSSFCIGK